MPDWLNTLYAGNRLLDYLLVAAGLLLSWLLLSLVKRYVIKLLREMAGRTKTQVDNVAIGAVDRFLVPLGYLLINFYLLSRLNVAPALQQGQRIVVLAGTIYLTVRMANHALHAGVVHYMRRRGESESRITQLSSMLLLVKALVWIVGVLLLLSNVGVNVAAALTGLGIGGIAIALATQNIFADLFSYFVIFFDQPFEIGDAITVNNQSGVVEKIGIKTTHLRSHDGQLLVVPNAELVKSTIQNFRQLQQRRVLFTLLVDLKTEAQALQTLPGFIQQQVEAMPQTSFGHCMLRQLTDKALHYEVQYHINSDDYGLMLGHQHQLLSHLHEQLASRNIYLVVPPAEQQVVLRRADAVAKNESVK